MLSVCLLCVDEFVVHGRVASHGFFERECPFDFWAFGELAAVCEEESDMHIEWGMLVIAVVMEVGYGNCVFCNIGEHVYGGRCFDDIQYVKRATIGLE